MSICIIFVKILSLTQNIKKVEFEEECNGMTYYGLWPRFFQCQPQLNFNSISIQIEAELAVFPFNTPTQPPNWVSSSTLAQSKENSN